MFHERKIYFVEMFPERKIFSLKMFPERKMFCNLIDSALIC